MCSISGFLASNPLERSLARRLTTSLLFYGQERGGQSAGVYANDHLCKSALEPSSFIDTSDFFSVFDRDTKYMLAHTRQPTSGGLGDKQAQPFRQGNTITVHNGFFFDTHSLKQEFSLRKKSGVDSELVTNFIHSYGITSLPKFITSTDGPSALAIAHDDEIYLMRSGNPTFYTKLKLPDETQLMIWASTNTILLDALLYCFLLNKRPHIEGTQEGVLLKVTPTSLERLSEKVSYDFSSHCLTRVNTGWPDHLVHEYEHSERISRLYESGILNLNPAQEQKRKTSKTYFAKPKDTR